MWSAHSYYMVEVMLVRYVNINARCRASGVLVPLACVVRGTNEMENDIAKWKTTLVRGFGPGQLQSSSLQ